MRSGSRPGVSSRVSSSARPRSARWGSAARARGSAISQAAEAGATGELAASAWDRFAGSCGAACPALGGVACPDVPARGLGSVPLQATNTSTSAANRSEPRFRGARTLQGIACMLRLTYVLSAADSCERLKLATLGQGHAVQRWVCPWGCFARTRRFVTGENANKIDVRGLRRAAHGFAIARGGVLE